MVLRNVDFRIVFDGLVSRQQSPEQAAVLFRERIEAVAHYLPDRLVEALDNARDRDTTDLNCPAGRLLDVHWRLFGAARSAVLFGGSDLPLVRRFLHLKLSNALDEFTDNDLAVCSRVVRDEKLRAAVRQAQIRKLAALADLLIRNPQDRNCDIEAVKGRIAAYNFPPELNEVLDKVEAGLVAGGDRYDQAALLKHLRTFYEKLHEQAAERLRAEKVPLSADKTDFTKCQQAIDYLERHGVLTDKMKALSRALYGVPSEEGVHSLKADREYVRFCRNMIAAYSLILFFELDRRLRQ